MALAGSRPGDADPAPDPREPATSGPNQLQLDLTWTDASGDLGFYEADLPR